LRHSSPLRVRSDDPDRVRRYLDSHESLMAVWELARTGNYLEQQRARGYEKQTGPLTASLATMGTGGGFRKPTCFYVYQPRNPEVTGIAGQVLGSINFDEAWEAS
jgi:hypothetical protein